VDTVRAIAEGNIIWRAGKTVFLCEGVPAEFLCKVDSDDPVIQEMVATWEKEEEEE
jgi:RNA:NAD 2'-phosphotransferase (TPT1/KptA family)